MNISMNLAKQIIESDMVQLNTVSINEIGGHARCIDSAGKWFMLEWWHGNQVTNINNISGARHIYIGE